MFGIVSQVNDEKGWALFSIPTCTRPVLASFRDIVNSEKLDVSEIVNCDVRIDSANLRAQRIRILVGREERKARHKIVFSTKWAGSVHSGRKYAGSGW